MKDFDPIQAALLQKFLSIPYKHRGRGMDGADCYGVIILWYRMRLGMELMDVEDDYPSDWNWSGRHYFLENYHHEWERVDHPRNNDVVLFKVGSEINHAGIYLGNGKFLHLSAANASIGNLDVPGWMKRVEGFYRHNDIYENHSQIYSKHP